VLVYAQPGHRNFHVHQLLSVSAMFSAKAHALVEGRPLPTPEWKKERDFQDRRKSASSPQSSLPIHRPPFRQSSNIAHENNVGLGERHGARLRLHEDYVKIIVTGENRMNAPISDSIRP